jgi:serine/threonine-protein kinase RsbW
VSARREDGRAALVIACQRERGRSVADALERAGYSARVISCLDHLDLHADARPALVIGDLEFEKPDEEWAEIARHFPDAVLWALVQPGVSTGDALVAAVEQGCQDYLTYPVARDELARKLREIERWRDQGANGADLDAYMSTEITLEVPSDRALIEGVVRHLAARCRDFRGYSPRTLMNFRVALCESLSNAMIYGNQEDPGRVVRVRARVDAGAIRVEVTDEGHGFDPNGVPDPTQPAALESARGRGLFLLRNLADEVSFNERGNSVTFILRSGPDRR